MTALSFRQVRDRLNLSSDDDLLSLIARVPQWKDGELWLSPNRWCYPPGEPLTLSLAGERYISDALQDDAMCWVEREDFRYAGRDPATTRPYTAAHWNYNGDGNAWFSLVPSTTSDAGIKVNINQDATATPATTPMTPAPPPAVELTACGWYSLRSVTIEEDSATLCLAPPGSPGHPVLPLYLRLLYPLPDALAVVMSIRDDGFHILKELLASSTSDAKQPHDVIVAPVGQPPAEGNTTAAKTDTAAQDTQYTAAHFAPNKPRTRGAAAKRRALAVLVGHVIHQPVNAMDDLPARLEAMRPGGRFQSVINEWLEKLSDDERQCVEEIAGVSTDSWPDCTRRGETPEHLTRMIWLCLAKLHGVAAVYDTDVKERANKVRNCFGHYGGVHIGTSAAMLPTHSAVLKWINPRHGKD
ncbi:hypothetical protein KY591_003044 [Escherichia coli]|nr:hypothetical protein [Escherichia coli]